jgi:hypothetical protein
MFDWELQLEDSTSVEAAEPILDECKTAGKPAQYMSFTSGRAPSGEDWAALARRQGFGFSFWGLDDDPVALGEAVRSLGPRFNYRVGAGADPQVVAGALFG